MIELWTVYFNPKDYPGLYVVRRFEGERPTQTVFTAATFKELQARHIPRGLVFMPRDPGDDPCIVGVFL